MNELTTKELLMKLSDLDGPSGYEDSVVSYIESLIKPFVDETKITGHGSLVGYKKGEGKGKLAFFAHVDEIGFVVSKVEGEFARLEPVGGIDPKVVCASRVRVHTREGVTLGVIGMLAPHLQSPDSRGKVPSFDELFLDLSLSDRAVRIGDVAVIDQKSFEAAGKVVGKALDNRASCASLIKTLEFLKRYSHPWDVYFVFSVQEETGCLGALTEAYRINPDVAVVMDVTFASEPPSHDHIELGKGPVIGLGPVVDKSLVQKILQIAKKHNVTLQNEVVGGRSGTETDFAQLVRAGVRTALISIPLKYMHTPVEMVDPRDVEELARLLSIIAVELEV
nr:M42 family metallopeptidase [Thermotoga sp. SG1]